MLISVPDPMIDLRHDTSGMATIVAPLFCSVVLNTCVSESLDLTKPSKMSQYSVCNLATVHRILFMACPGYYAYTLFCVQLVFEDNCMSCMHSLLHKPVFEDNYVSITLYIVKNTVANVQRQDGRVVKALAC